MPQANDSPPSRVIGRPPLRLAFVGAGRVTETCHLPAIQHLKDQIEVVALAEVDEHRRRRVAGMFEIRQAFGDVVSMLRDADSIDAVAICTPAMFHAEAAAAAIQAGKHVFVEKPLALSLDDADRIVASAQNSKATVMMGFNLRHHRLVQQARQMLADGVVGDVHLIRSVWSSGIRSRMRVPDWRSRRTSGGGSLAEIAVHHIDLVRYLTGREITQVFAKSTHGEGDDAVAALTLSLDNGATVTSAFTELSGDANEFEIIGSRGRLAFSIYQFDSLRFTPVGNYGGRVGRMVQSFKDLIRAWPILRRGGDFRETYVQEWRAFADLVRQGGQAIATPEDGRQALRVVLAAGASANRGMTVEINDAPRQPEATSVPDRAPIDETTDNASGGPHISAIVSTRESIESIRRTIRHLRDQTIQSNIELVIVCSNKDKLKLDTGLVEGFWGHQIIEIGDFESIARANAAGAQAARAQVVVFCEDHSFPDPNWARSLVIAHRGPYAVVGPAVHNANPSTWVSRADFLVGYGPWAEPIKPCEPEHLPGHNSSYKRDILLGYGDRVAEMLEAESVLHWKIRQSGHRLYLDPSARLAHTNFAFLSVWTKVQYHAGRVFGGTRAIGWPIWKRLVYAAASPLIPLVRFKRICGDARRLRGTGFVGPGVIVTLIWGLLLDGVGQMVGYALGFGESEKIAYEFCRVNHITEEDRRKLQAEQQPSSCR